MSWRMSHSATGTMSSPAVLSVEDVSLRLAAREVLRSISLQVAPGEIWAVAGPNGAGKSTLLRVMAGLKAPDTGRATLGGESIMHIDRRARAKRIAYLPQDRTVHWPLTARAVVALGRLPHGGGPGRAESAVDTEAIEAALDATDSRAFAARPVSELSGGERARVLIARALAQDAGLLIADEPTAGLDPTHALALFETVTRIAGKGRAVVVALHDLSLALRYASHVALLKDGTIAASGPSRDVLTEENMARVFAVTARIGDIGGVPAVVPVSSLT